MLILISLACVPEDTHRGRLVSDIRVGLHPEIATVIEVSWEQLEAGEVWLSWAAEGQQRSSPALARPAGAASEVILGLPSLSTAEEIVLHVAAGGREEVVTLGSISTGALPPDLSDGALLSAADSQGLSGPYVLTSVDVGPEGFRGPCYAVILDRQGRIVWYRATPDSHLTWQPRISLAGGSILVDELTLYTIREPADPTLTRLTLDLRQQEVFTLPELHLAYAELPDGGFLYDEYETSFDYFLVRRRPDGSDQRIWSCNPWMDPYVLLLDSCATNTVLLREDRQSVLWSTYRTSTIAEIDLESGELLRSFGAHTDSYSFAPPESAFELQHYPNWTEQGTLLLSAHDPQTDTQVAREFRVDETSRSLELLWETSTEHYATYAGQIQRTASGNLLWELGTAGVILEMDAGGEVLWELQLPASLVGNATAIPDLYALNAGW